MTENLKISRLNWDSNFFDLSVGKIDISLLKNSGDLSELEKLIHKSEYDLVYIFSSLSQCQLLKFDKISPLLTDTQICLRMDIPLKIEPLEYKLITKDNMSLMDIKIEDLYKISDQVVPVSRFSNDPRISKAKVKELYHKFIQNSLEGSFGKGLIIDRNDKDEIVSLISTDSNGKFGREILIGIDKSHKGGHFGRRIFNKSLNYWRDNGIREIETIVSARNLESLNFHLRMGFSIYRINNVYHLWIKD